MNHEKERGKQPPIGKVIGVIIALSVLSPEIIGIVILIGVIYVIFRLVKASKLSLPEKTADTFDECPKPICFHKDKGEHHVRKGKEIDPWDRPDIDISKYQRR